MNEYKERFCPACSRWKPLKGVWTKVMNKNRFCYYRCDECQERRVKQSCGAIRPVEATNVQA